MKNQDYYEINLQHLVAVCLLSWRKILCMMLACVIAALGISVMTARPPAENSKIYLDIETAVSQRAAAQEQLAAQRQSLEENLFQHMKPEQIVTKRLTILVELNDPALISEQLDPTDLIGYAYHNLARFRLQGDVLVPSILTKQQQEQLLHLSYSAEQNLLTVSMTADDEALVDEVLQIARQWYQDQFEDITEQTYLHTLTVLPVSETVYDRSTRAEMVSTADQELAIRELEQSVYEYNTALDTLFEKREGWAADKDEAEIQALLQEKKQKDALPAVWSPLVTGILLGLFLSLLWWVFPMFVKQRLLGDQGLSVVVDWQYLGRLNEISPSADPLSGMAHRLLYSQPYMEAGQQRRDLQETVAMLLEDRGIHGAATVALLGNVSGDAMQNVTEVLTAAGITAQAAQLPVERVKAQQLCRSADAVIFVAQADAVTVADVAAVAELLKPLNIMPLGYVLV